MSENEQNTREESEVENKEAVKEKKGREPQNVSQS
jgi:hypothetical protein